MKDKSTQEMTEVMLAGEAGKEIRRRCKSNPNDKAGCIKLGDLYNWIDYDYWIVEEKKQEPLEFWVNIYKSGTFATYTEKQLAIEGKEYNSSIETIKVREVIE